MVMPGCRFWICLPPAINPCIVFNGEIYNHLELLGKLTGLPWRGHSDTETLLAAFETWGVEKTLQATIWMFALALWDRVERRLILARNRIGEKLLYYGVAQRDVSL